MNPVRIKLYKATGVLPVCSSRWWGNPDLPVDMEYPYFKDIFGCYYPYNFICQIRLEDVAKVRPHNELPRNGMLYFFAKIDYFLGRNVPADEIPGCNIWKKGDIKVLYVSNVDEADFTERKIEEFDTACFSPVARKIEFLEEETFREYKDKGISLPGHQLFGEPYLMACNNPSASNTWKLLLQVDSDSSDDFTLKFINDGLLCFVISPKDLKLRNFSKVKAVIISPSPE